MKKEILIGLLTLITIAVAIWGYNFILGKNFFKAEKTFHTQFEDVTDLAVSSQVMINGLPIGVVSSIAMNEENVNKVDVSITVDNDIKVPKNAKIILQNNGIMGSRYIELAFDKVCNGTNCAENGQFLQSVEKSLLGSVVSKDDFGGYVQELETLIDKLGAEDENSALNKIVQNLNSSMENLAGATNSMDRILARSAKNLDKTIENLATISTTLSTTNTKINTILGNFEVMSQDVKKMSLSNTLAKTDGTIEQANTTLKQMESTIGEASKTVNELTQVIAKMDSDEGSLGRLLNDPGLYDNLESTSKNLDLLLQDFRLNPKRYVNVSVFGKKAKSYTLPEDDPASGK